jgi:predicted DNA-binding transcriptional regulator AlpA
MLATTIEIIRSGLKSDPSLTPAVRARLLALLRNGSEPPKPETPGERVARIIRRAEVAQRLSCSLRTVDGLAATGVLKKRKLPGRVRASGFLESEVANLIAG